MNFILPIEEITEDDRFRVGGKGFALAVMARKGLQVPPALAVTTEAYREYVQSTKLGEKILIELHRKAFEDMRWEEIWDTALRIRNLFLQTPIPEEIRNPIALLLQSFFSGHPVAVRSSAPGEDAAQTSFAGLHESYIQVRGAESILEHIRLVWASLWSDRALLYRQELGLDVEKSTMAVVVQKMILGERSGVVFGRSPMDASQAVIEAVHGLNQGLVDGTIEPDRWTLDRKTGEILTHHAPKRERAMVFSSGRVRLEPLPPERQAEAPLKSNEIGDVYRLAMSAEEIFKSPQDVEWTYRGDALFALQSRPITTGASAGPEDPRRWYLSLTRSFENLKGLRTKIERELVPSMVEEAVRLSQRECSLLSDSQLADEIEYRLEVYQHWEDLYKEYFIPFAHGMRLFGKVYNDVVQPADPFAFLDLLTGREMESVKRNRMLEDLAAWIRRDPGLRETLQKGKMEEWDPAFRESLERFFRQYGALSWEGSRIDPEADAFARFLLALASREPKQRPPVEKDRSIREAEFLSHFEGEERRFATELLDLGRASYRWRDDDNIFMGKIKGQMVLALDEGKRRLQARGMAAEDIEASELIKALKDPCATLPRIPEAKKRSAPETLKIRGRQIVGQPAGPGIAVGKARVVHGRSDLFSFQPGEILVCDAIDPNMTFAVPLAAGIVERRGGMLIHGAIIAREYGLPCVTGVPEATNFIKTGDLVTVDGFLGIVTIGSPTFPGEDSPA